MNLFQTIKLEMLTTPPQLKSNDFLMTNNFQIFFSTPKIG